MAGEMLAQILDVDEFDRIQPVLDRLDAGDRLTAPEQGIVREAIDAAAARQSVDRSQAALLDRVLRHPNLAPRLFMTPDALEAAVDAVLYGLAIAPRDGWPTTRSGGENWIWIERGVLSLYDRPTLNDAFIRCVEPYTRALPQPRRGESRLFVLDHMRLAEIGAEIDALSAQPALDCPEETQALAALVLRAAARPSATIVFRFML